MNEKRFKKIAKELGSAGGKKTLKLYGTKHFSKIAKKRWEQKRDAEKAEE